MHPSDTAVLIIRLLLLRIPRFASGTSHFSADFALFAGSVVGRDHVNIEDLLAPTADVGVDDNFT
jgi:hypothetical protein